MFCLRDIMLICTLVLMTIASIVLSGVAAVSSGSISGTGRGEQGAGKVDPMPTADVFPITFWAMHYLKDSPDYEKAISNEQYQLIKECNFNLVMGGPLKQAERFGLQCMSDAIHIEELRGIWWPPHEPAVTEKNRLRIMEAISAVDKTSPSLWGYHLTDEPPPVLYPRVKVLSEVIKSVDPTRPVFVSLHPGSDAAKFIEEVDPDLCAYDHYPIFEDGVPRDENIPPGFDNSGFLIDLARFRRDTLAAGRRFSRPR